MKRLAVIVASLFYFIVSSSVIIISLTLTSLIGQQSLTFAFQAINFMLELKQFIITVIGSCAANIIFFDGEML